MAKTTYYLPPQEIYSYLADDPEVAQSWQIDSDTVGTMFINGVISEGDFSGSLSGSSVVYMTAVRSYMPGGTDLAFATTGLRIPITGDLTEKQIDGIVSSQPMFTSGTNQDDIFTVDPYSATTLRLTKNGFLENSKEIDASGGSDLLKIEDAYASGKYTFSRNESGDIVGIASHLYQGPVVLKNFEYVSFTDTGRRTIESFFETPAEKDSSATSSPSNGDASQTGNTLDVIVDLFGTVSMLKGLIEVDNGTVHTLTYNGTVFNYAEVDPLITTVVRNGEFTAEFAQEIADAYPSAAGIKYNTVVTLLGVAAIDDLLISVAGADGFYVL